MFNHLLSEEVLPVKGLDPVADAFAGTVTSDVVSLSLYEKVCFLVYKGVGATGTSTLTVQASAANDGGTPTAIPFRSRRLGTGGVPDAVVQQAAAGFNTTAGSSDMYLIEVLAKDLPEGKPWVHLKAVEVVDSPVVGCIIPLLGDPKYSGAELPSAI